MSVYILLRNDINFTCGIMVAQACHACMKLLHTFSECETYVSDDMRKVVLQTNLAELNAVKETLLERGIGFVEWTEQPENLVTCLATVPLQGLQKEIFRKLKKL